MLKHCVVYIACLWHLSTIPINLILTPTTLCHNEMSMRVGVEAEFWCTKLKLVKWEITLSKLGLSLHGVADPDHRQKGQLCHTTSGINIARHYRWKATSTTSCDTLWVSLQLAMHLCWGHAITRAVHWVCVSLCEYVTISALMELAGPRDFFCTQAKNCVHPPIDNRGASTMHTSVCTYVHLAMYVYCTILLYNEGGGHMTFASKLAYIWWPPYLLGWATRCIYACASGRIF